MKIGKEEQAAATAPSGRLLDRHKVDVADKRAHLVFWPIAVLGCLLDLWTKAAVFAWLRIGESAEIIDGILTVRPALNSGAAFGIASGHQGLLVAVSILALVMILGVFFFGGTRHRLSQAALGLFAAGVCGNLWDRLFNGGQVRDFIDVVYWPGRHWHTFNVADAMLCIAVGLLVVTALLTDSSCRKPRPPQK
jgi:signal peptidase II